MNQPNDPRSKGTLKILLIIFGVLFLLCAGGGGTAVYYFFQWGKGMDVYQAALDRAAAHPLVIERIGLPLDDGDWPHFSVNFNGGFGDASFSNSISGPNGSGTIELQARKTAATDWHYTLVQVVLDDGTIIDLNDGLVAPSPPTPSQDGPTQDQPMPDPGSGQSRKSG